MVYPITKLFLGNLIKLYIRDINGLEHLPKSSFIIVANHSSYADDLFIPYIIVRHLNKNVHMFVNSRFYKAFFIKKFLDHYRCIPVDVKKNVTDEKRRRRTNEKAFRDAIEFLRKKEVIGIFPEGGRSIDGKLKKAKTGAARLALEANVPVLPIGIKGSYEIIPKGTKFPHFRRADIIIGKPIYLNNYQGKEKDYKVLEEITTLIMKEIARLSNQEYNY